MEPILRLATKYDIKWIRDDIIRIISKDWPPQLEKWDFNEDELDVFKSHRVGGSDNVDLDLPEPYEAIRIALQYEIPDILTAAFYHLSRLAPLADRRLNNDAMSGTSNGDTALDLHAEYLSTGGRTAWFGLLSKNQLLQLARGKHEIENFFHNVCDDARASTSKRCQFATPRNQEERVKRKHCLEATEHLSNSRLAEFGRTRDPLKIMRIDHPTSPPSQLCGTCLEHFQRLVYGSRQDLWYHLENFFDFSGH